MSRGSGDADHTEGEDSPRRGKRLAPEAGQSSRTPSQPASGVGQIVKVLVADDSDFLREALCDWLDRKDSIQIVAQASSGMEAVALVQEVDPDVIVLDLRMPGMDGLEVAQIVTATRPGLGVVLFTSEERRLVIADAKEAGVRGFVHKSERPELLLEAIQLVARGEGAGL